MAQILSGNTIKGQLALRYNVKREGRVWSKREDSWLWAFTDHRSRRELAATPLILGNPTTADCDQYNNESFGFIESDSFNPVDSLSYLQTISWTRLNGLWETHSIPMIQVEGSIQDAVTQAAPNAIIVVPEGTYNETVILAVCRKSRETRFLSRKRGCFAAKTPS